jgi:hypothetical protein
MGSINMLGEGNVGDLEFVMGTKTTKFTKFHNKKKKQGHAEFQIQMVK